MSRLDYLELKSKDKILVQTESQLRDMFDYLNPYDFFCFDSETYGLKARPVGYSIAPVNDLSKSFYVSLDHETLFDINVDKQLNIDLFKKFLRLKKRSFLGHHISYDVFTFEMYLNIKLYYEDVYGSTNLDDSLILGYLVDVNAPKKLKERIVYEGLVKEASTLSDLVESKNPGTIPAENVLEYACNDVIYPVLLYRKFIKILKKTPIWKLYLTQEKPFIETISKLTTIGVKIDRNQLTEIAKDCDIMIKKYQSLVFEEAGEPFSIDSPQQVSHILYRKLKLKPQKYTPTGSPAADKKALELLKKVYKNKPILGYLEKYSEFSTLKTNFTNKLPGFMDIYDRVHPSFNHTGTVTGRLSSSKPNAQQIPRKKTFRAAFIPAKGKVFLIADYGQIELRVLAHVSQDEVMCHAIRNGIDLHDSTAMHMFDWDIEYVNWVKDRGKEDKTDKLFLEWVAARFKAKTVNFKVVYGGGKDLNLGIDDKFIKRYKEVHWGVEKYKKAFIKVTREYGYAYTIAGRTAIDPNIYSEDWETRGAAERAMFSLHIQGSAADVIKMAMNNIYFDLKKNHEGANLILQVHDELVIECWQKDAEIIKPKMQKFMETPYGLSVPLEATPTIGYSWADKE